MVLGTYHGIQGKLASHGEKLSMHNYVDLETVRARQVNQPSVLKWRLIFCVQYRGVFTEI